MILDGLTAGIGRVGRSRERIIGESNKLELRFESKKQILKHSFLQSEFSPFFPGNFRFERKGTSSSFSRQVTLAGVVELFVLPPSLEFLIWFVFNI